jgi:hypothetical protein
MDSKDPLTSLPQCDFDFATTSNLNFRIAENCITKIKDNHNSVTVFDAKNRGDLAKLSLYKSIDNPFFKSLDTLLPSSEFAYENGGDAAINELGKSLTKYDTVIVSLFVPKAKPLNNFDIEDSVLKFLANLFISKKCVLYVFGNPYALQVIPNLENTLGIVQMYQDFEEFQEAAASQLLENSECKGTLPVILRDI